MAEQDPRLRNAPPDPDRLQYVQPQGLSEDNKAQSAGFGRNSIADGEVNPGSGFTPTVAEERESRSLRDRVGGARDTIQGAKDKFDDTKDKIDKIKNAKDKIQGAKKAANATKTAIKTGKTAAQAGKAGAQAAGAASGAATAGAGTVATAAEMAAEAIAKKAKKVASGDFSVSKKTIFALMVPITVAAIFIIGLIYLPKFGAKTITSTMRNSLMDRVQFTVKQRANLYLADYAQDVLLPNLKECGTAINTDCYAGKTGETQRHQTLYDSWHRGKIMDRINTRYGFTFQDGGTNNYEDIKVYKEGEYVTNYKTYYDSGLAIEQIMGITEAQGVNERWVLRHTVNSRFGGKWCIMLCADSDALANENLDLLDKMKLKVSSRVISKSASRVAALLSCGPSCTPAILADTAKAAAKKALAVADSKFLREIFEELGPQKIVEFLTTKIIENLFSLQGIAKTANFLASLPLKAVHTVTSVIGGSINFVKGFIESKEINEFTAEKNLSEYSDAQSSIVSSVDEVATGHAPIQQQGATFRYMSRTVNSRMWQKIRGIQPKSPETCLDGTIIQGEDDPMTCPEQHIIPDLKPEETVNNPLFGFFQSAADAIFKGLSFLPGLGSLGQVPDLISNLGKSVGFITTEVTPTTYTEDPGGKPRVGGVLAGGYMTDDNVMMMGTADVDGGRVSMAGKFMNPQTQATLDLAIAHDKNVELSRQSLYARYLDPNNPTSLFSSTMLNVATSMPMLMDEPLHFHFNPFTFIGNLGMALGFSQKASAQGAISLGDRSQYFKIPSIGYDTEELAIKPKTLTEQKCTDLYAEREASFEDLGDGVKLPMKSDICQADDTVILDLTGWTRLQPKEILDQYLALGDQGASAAAPTGEGCESTPVQVQTAKGSIFVCKVGNFTVNVTIAKGLSGLLKKAAQDGIKLGGGALRTHLEQHKLRAAHGCGGDGSGVHTDNEDPSKWVSASSCSPPTAKPGQSNHEQGEAIDFTFNGAIINSHSNGGYVWLNANAGQYGLQNLPSEPWHWSKDGK